MESVKLFVQEHLTFKKQLVELAKADIIKTYRGASLGWLWALIKPSITIFVYFFAFRSASGLPNLSPIIPE